MPNLISQRQYNNRCKLTVGLCEEIRRRIAEEIDGGEGCLIVDPKPIEVCKPACFKRCALGYGDKLHGLKSTSGMFHSYDITAANVYDIKYLKDVKLEYHDYGIIDDKGYAEVQLKLFETANIRLKTPSRSNQKNTFRWMKKGRLLHLFFAQSKNTHSTVTDLAKLRGWSTLQPRITAM